MRKFFTGSTTNALMCDLFAVDISYNLVIYGKNRVQILCPSAYLKENFAKEC